MTTYNANTTVTINGTDYSGSCLRQITVSMGRPDLQQQPQAGYCRVQLITDWDTVIPVEANQPLVITIYNPITAAQQAIFTGRVSDYSVSVETAGVVSGVARYDVTAVGPLADLARQTCGYGDADGFAFEAASTVIETWLGEAYGPTWDDLGSLTWDDLGTTTWDTLLGADIIGTIVPSTWLLTSTAETRNALEGIHLAADSALGVVYETGDGKINFYDSDFRETGSFTAVPKTIIATDLNSALRMGEVITKCTTADWGGNIATVTATSVLDYGLLEVTRDTLLSVWERDPGVSGPQTEEQSFLIISYRSVPYRYPDQITVNLNNQAVTDNMRQFLLGTYCGSKISVTDLPQAFFSDSATFYGFVEGHTWNLTDIMAEITLNVSDARLNYGGY